MSFFFYDYETTGIDAKRDRILQFAGIRTDEDFNIIEKPIAIYCKLSKEIIPHPEALLVTGITPEILNNTGLNEPNFINAIYKEFMTPNTCVIGYNNIRFDDEFTRYGFYRNFYDPYAREWQNYNSRYDLIDLIRMCSALRPENINWPIDSNTKNISFKLEELTSINNIKHTKSHDALSDVYATIELARLIKSKQSKLFNYLLTFKNKENVVKTINIAEIFDNTIPVQNKLIVHASGMISNEYFATSIFLPLIKHPLNKNEIITWDLRYTPDKLFALNNDVKYAKELLYAKNNETRLNLKTISYNKAPALAPISTLNDSCLKRIKLNLEQVIINAKAIIANKEIWLNTITDIYKDKLPFDNTDVDHQLYDGFIPNADRVICNQVLLGSLIVNFTDQRLAKLLFRYKARNFPESLNLLERVKWQEYCTNRLNNIDNIAGICKKTFVTKSKDIINSDPKTSAVLQQWLDYLD